MAKAKTAKPARTAPTKVTTKDDAADTGKSAASAKNPDGVVLDLALHAATLAGTVRANLAGLSTTRVFEPNATKIEAGCDTWEWCGGC